MEISSEQVRAARALLRWEQKQLAEASGVSLPSIKRLESQPGLLGAHSKTLDALISAFQSAGVTFLADGETTAGGPGVRLKTADGNG